MSTENPSLAHVSRDLAARCDALRFHSVAYVYGPLDYARTPHEHYLERFGAGAKEVARRVGPAARGDATRVRCVR